MSMEDLFELFEEHGIGNDLSDSELENLYNLFSNTSSETLEIFFDALEESGIALEDISSDELLEIFEEASEQYSDVGDVSYSTDGTQDSPTAIDAPEEGSLKSHGISFGGYQCGMSCKADGGISTGGTIFWTLRSS